MSLRSKADRAQTPDIERIADLVRDGSILRGVEEAVGALESA